MLLQIIHIVEYYDLPQVVLCKDFLGRLFVALLVKSDVYADYYCAVRLPRLKDNDEERRIDLKQLLTFTRPDEAFQIAVSTHDYENWYKAEAVFGTIPAEWIPLGAFEIEIKVLELLSNTYAWRGSHKRNYLTFDLISSEWRENFEWKGAAIKEQAHTAPQAVRESSAHYLSNQSSFPMTIARTYKPLKI